MAFPCYRERMSLYERRTDRRSSPDMLVNVRDQSKSGFSQLQKKSGSCGNGPGQGWPPSSETVMKPGNIDSTIIGEKEACLVTE
jgi:hypothetical protein